MLTVPEAARRVGRDPETIQRWIRTGKLPSKRIGHQHFVDEMDVAWLAQPAPSLPLPEEWKMLSNSRPQLDWVTLVRRTRQAR